MDYAIKAIESGGEWKLEIRAVPFGGPMKGKDAHGEYFDARTKTHPDKFTAPPLVYYHSFETDGRPQGSPIYIGKSVGQWEMRADGWYIGGLLDPRIPEAHIAWKAAKEERAAVSTGTAAHLMRPLPPKRNADGHIDEWPVVEISVWDSADAAPANSYAVAIPAMKAVYTQAGLAIPDLLDQTAIEPQDGGTGEQQPASTVESGAVSNLKAWQLRIRAMSILVEDE